MQPIYILHEHSDGCKYIPGNSVKQYNGKSLQTENIKK